MAQGCDPKELPEITGRTPVITGRTPVITGRTPVITGRIPEINWRKMFAIKCQSMTSGSLVCPQQESLKYLVISEKFIVGEPVKYFPDVTSIGCKVEFCLRICIELTKCISKLKFSIIL